MLLGLLLKHVDSYTSVPSILTQRQHKNRHLWSGNYHQYIMIPLHSSCFCKEPNPSQDLIFSRCQIKTLSNTEGRWENTRNSEVEREENIQELKVKQEPKQRNKKAKLKVWKRKERAVLYEGMSGIGGGSEVSGNSWFEVSRAPLSVWAFMENWVVDTWNGYWTVNTLSISEKSQKSCGRHPATRTLFAYSFQKCLIIFFLKKKKNK